LIVARHQPLRGRRKEENSMLQLIATNLTVLIIAGLYYSWRDRFAKANEQRQVLRQRVAYMLWAAAQRA